MTDPISPMKRMSLGIPGCDDILGGGLIAGRSYLLVGPAGSGKTTFALQWLRDGVRQGESCMYITLAEPGVEIQRNVAGFGWTLDGIEVVDLSPTMEGHEQESVEYSVFPSREVEQTSAWISIYQAVKKNRPNRLMIDSMTQLRYVSTDDVQFRRNVLGLVNFLNSVGCTALLAYEPGEMDEDMSVALAVDGVMRLGSSISPSLAIGLRSFQVEKLRGSDFLSGRHPLRIGAAGIVVFPHRIERAAETRPGERIISSGIPNLDLLLGGGLESGTTTLLSGPTGSGKTTLGTQFLAHMATNKSAVLFSFEESPSFIATRSRNVGIPIDAVLASGALKIVRVNPLELYPDEFLALVHNAVEEEGRSMVMVDSLRGYHLTMDEFGSAEAHIHNLVSYLTRKEVTTLLINETVHISSTSLMATDIGVSHLADNIVLLRYAERGPRMVKLVSCLKKRTGGFEHESRELQITAAGIKVSEKLENLRGVLSGSPRFNEG